MNNKEFIAELSKRLGYTIKDTTDCSNALLAEMMQQWQERNGVTIKNFGSFEVKKKAERVSVNPTTKQRLLIPPKLVLTYKPATSLKEKFK